MTTNTISDQALITAAHPLTAPPNSHGRKYRAVYNDGTDVAFAVGHADAAKVYAREYGIRFLNNAKVVSVKWQR